MKKFITSISLQRPGSTKYDDLGVEALAFPQKTAWPILHSLYNQAEPGEEIEVMMLIVLEEGDYANILEANIADLQAAIAALCAPGQKLEGLTVKYTKIELPDKQSDNETKYLVLALLDHLNPGDTIYYDATYGTKLTPVITISVLQYACKVMPGFAVGGIVYGRMKHNVKDEDGNKKSFIYDASKILRLNSMADTLAEIDADKPNDVVNFFFSTMF